MLTLEKTPGKVDMLYNGSPFIVKDSNALKYVFDFAKIEILVSKFSYELTIPLFTIEFPYADIDSITFYVIPHDQENYDGITIRGATEVIPLGAYTDQVIEDLLKNYTLGKNYEIYRGSSLGSIIFEAKTPGKEYIINITNISGDFSIGVFPPSTENIDQQLQEADYYTRATYLVGSTTFTHKKKPDSFDSYSGLTHFRNENIIERIVAKDNKVTFTFPAPDEFTLIPKYAGLISYQASFAAFYNYSQQKSVNDEVRYLAAGGVSNVLRLLLDEQNKEYFQKRSGQFLSNMPEKLHISTDAPIRLYFATLPTPGLTYVSNHRVKIIITFSDNTESVFTTAFQEIPAYSLGEVICGYNELKLDEKYDKKISKYSVSVVNSADHTIAAALTFFPFTSHRPTTSFAFYNSFGVPEFLTFFGKREETESAEIAEYDKDNPSKPTMPNELSISGALASGFLHYTGENPQNTIDWLNDFARSKEAYLLDDGGFTPVKVVEVDTMKKEHGLLSASIGYEVTESQIYSKGAGTAFIDPPDPPPPPVTPVLLLEDGTGGILLEDGSYNILEKHH